MNKKESTSIENSSEIKEEKKMDFKKFWGWGFGLITALILLGYLAGYITFGTTPAIKDSEKKTYFSKDSLGLATEAKLDSAKKKAE